MILIWPIAYPINQVRVCLILHPHISWYTNYGLLDKFVATIITK